MKLETKFTKGDWIIHKNSETTNNHKGSQGCNDLNNAGWN